MGFLKRKIESEIVIYYTYAVSLIYIVKVNAIDAFF